MGSKLRQRVIMRFDPKYLPYKPNNVLVEEWIPQQEILAHKKTLLFVSHCGMTGILEAIYHRVPIVGIANFADQIDNAVRIQDKGLGVSVSKHDLNADKIYDAIQEVLKNDSYRNEVNRIANIWQDQPRTPIDEATYWLELLIKYKNFDHWKIN